MNELDHMRRAKAFGRAAQQQKTIYSKRLFVAGEDSKVILQIATAFSCRLRGLRIDGDKRSRQAIGVHEVRSWRTGPLLTRALSAEIGGPDEEYYISVEALETTVFDEEWRAAEIFEVEIETWSPDINVCLIANVELETQ